MVEVYGVNLYVLLIQIYFDSSDSKPLMRKVRLRHLLTSPSTCAAARATAIVCSGSRGRERKQRPGSDLSPATAQLVGQVRKMHMFTVDCLLQHRIFIILYYVTGIKLKRLSNLLCTNISIMMSLPNMFCSRCHHHLVIP